MTARTVVAVVVAASCAMGPWARRDATAFCGFYVAGADSDLYNNATVVAMMRAGTRTVLSMQNNYQGPPEDFAMVVPVPVVLKKAQVRTLPRDVFARLDRLAAPRLVEYWEQDPCPLPEPDYSATRSGTIGAGSGTGSGYGSGAGLGRKVVVEAEFAVGEYDIVILSAKDALALETWLGQNGYRIPKGAATYLRPYVESGSKFFVAKVDIEKVEMKDGMAMLSPLRFHYDDEAFSLPVRLGLINSAGTQDLIVHILAPDTRYEVANYPNATIPTNLFVADSVRGRFGEFYAALLDATLEKTRGAVVTEYAWSAGSCDPCPESPLSDSELATLGLDVLYDDQRPAAAPQRAVVRPAGRPIVKGTDFEPMIIARFVRRYLQPMSMCYQRAVEAGKTSNGRAKLTFEIGPDGAATAVKVTGLADRQVASCMAEAFGKAKLPKQAAGAKVLAPLILQTHSASGGMARRFVLTRLHARYGADSLGEDLVFKRADPINGGTGGASDGISQDAESASISTFQGRYIIRHPWEGEIACESPRRGVWGGPPPDAKDYGGPTAATDLAFVKRGAFPLGAAVTAPVPALALEPGAAAAKPTSTPADEPPAQDEEARPEAPPLKKVDKGCGCRTAPSGAAGWLAGLAVLLLLRRRRRRT